MIARVIRTDATPDINGDTRLILTVIPIWGNNVGDTRVPLPNEVITIDVIGKPFYVTGHDEKGRPQWDLSAPENR